MVAKASDDGDSENEHEPSASDEEEDGPPLLSCVTFQVAPQRMILG